MKETVSVVLLGTGHMGTGIGRLVLEKQGLELVGAVGRRKERAGKDLGEILGLGKNLNIRLSADLDDVVKQRRPDVVIQCTGSRVTDVYPEIQTALCYGANVISIAEEMSYPSYGSPELAEKMHALAVKHGATVLGTGINPGFILDYLIITLTGVCMTVDTITASRINDLSPYGPSVLQTQGVGLTPEEFKRRVREGSVKGHFGFPESISMIARSLGWKIDRIEQSRKPIVSKVRRQTPVVTIEPGHVAGCEHVAIGYIGDKPAVTLIHPQQVHPHLEDVQTGDHIRIRGIPDINFSNSPEIPGGIGTIALAVNMIPHVINASPGLVTMADLPAPAALLEDIRNRIGKERKR